MNDALRLRDDPAMRWVIGDEATKRSGASPSQMGRFETNWLARPENLAALVDLSGHWIDQVLKHRPSGRVVLDMDSSVSPTHGDQEGASRTGISFALATIRCSCSTSSGIWNDARFAPATHIAFRGDAAFAQPNLYEYLESEGIEPWGDCVAWRIVA